MPQARGARAQLPVSHWVAVPPRALHSVFYRTALHSLIRRRTYTLPNILVRPCAPCRFCERHWNVLPMRSQAWLRARSGRCILVCSMRQSLADQAALHSFDVVAVMLAAGRTLKSPVDLQRTAHCFVRDGWRM